MRDLTKIEIFYVLSLIVSFVLFFLSVGVLVANGTNVVVPYISLSIAIALSLATLIVGVVRTQKPVFQQPQSQPVTPTLQVPYLQKPVEKPVAVVSSPKNEQIDDSPAKNEETAQKVANNYGETKIEPIDQLITPPADIQKIQENSIAQPTIETKTEDQKTIKPPEKARTKRNTVKSTPTKKTAAKRAKAKARKTK